MRRLRAVETVRPGALSQLIGALRLPRERAADLRADQRLKVFEAGGPVRREDISFLRKRLVSAQLGGWTDHRSGAYRAAWGNAAQAVAQMLR